MDYPDSREIRVVHKKVLDLENLVRFPTFEVYTYQEGLQRVAQNKKKIQRYVGWNEELKAYTISGPPSTYRLVNVKEWVEILNAQAHDEFSDDDYISVSNIIDKDTILVRQTSTQTDITSMSDQISSGFFEMTHAGGTHVIKPTSAPQDEYISLSATLDGVMREIKWFLESKEAYEKAKLAWRRGLLLYGPPGNGKTATILQAADAFRDRARIILLRDISIAGTFREYLTDIPTIFVLEEITEDIENHGAQELLNFLDGVHGWKNAMYIATTNYPEALPGNIVDRPSRFDALIKVDNPTDEGRFIYLSKHLNKEEVTKELIKATEGMSVAYLKEVVIRHKLKGQPLTEIITDYEKRKKLVKNEFAAISNLGF